MSNENEILSVDLGEDLEDRKGSHDLIIEIKEFWRNKES